MGTERNRTLSNYITEVTKMATKKAAVKSETKSNEISTSKIQFAFPAPEAKKVALAGDFNNWDPLANPMKKDKKGVWEVTVNLKPGRY